jgi:tRNA (cmo5U34)-methyltransferase
MKSTVEQIKARFDADVERFSNLAEGQSATIDSPLCMDLITRAAAIVTPGAHDILDIGCGAGNYTLKMIRQLSAGGSPNCTLVDLSRPMLDRAVQRVTAETTGRVEARQADMRDVDFGSENFDIVLAASTLHHLRDDEQWQAMFQKIHRALRPGGSFWIFDLIEHSMTGLQEMMLEKYGDYLIHLKGGGDEGRAYRDKVFAYVEQEDTPRSLVFQLELLRQVGFSQVDVLHKSVLFAAFGGVKR